MPSQSLQVSRLTDAVDGKHIACQAADCQGSLTDRTLECVVVGCPMVAHDACLSACRLETIAVDGASEPKYICEDHPFTVRYDEDFLRDCSELLEEIYVGQYDPDSPQYAACQRMLKYTTERFGEVRRSPTSPPRVVLFMHLCSSSPRPHRRGGHLDGHGSPDRQRRRPWNGWASFSATLLAATPSAWTGRCTRRPRRR